MVQGQLALVRGDKVHLATHGHDMQNGMRHDGESVVLRVVRTKSITNNSIGSQLEVSTASISS